jgi:hypothetical protein
VFLGTVISLFNSIININKASILSDVLPVLYYIRAQLARFREPVLIQSIITGQNQTPCRTITTVPCGISHTRSNFFTLYTKNLTKILLTWSLTRTFPSPTNLSRTGRTNSVSIKYFISLGNGHTRRGHFLKCFAAFGLMHENLWSSKMMKDKSLMNQLSPKAEEAWHNDISPATSPDTGSLGSLCWVSGAQLSAIAIPQDNQVRIGECTVKKHYGADACDKCIWKVAEVLHHLWTKESGT